MQSHGIIFDFDGTLTNSLDQALISFNYALAQVNAPPRTPEEIKRFFGGGADRILASLLGDKTLGLRAFEHFLVHQALAESRSVLHQGVLQMLEQLHHAGIPLAVVTGRHSRDLEIQLRPHGIAHYFSVLVTDDLVARSKPAPDSLLLAAKKLGLPPARTLYVGDSVGDMQAAHAAGCKPVAALWDPLVKPEALAAEHPFQRLAHPHELWKSLEALADMV